LKYALYTHITKKICKQEVYHWQNVDLYIGGRNIRKFIDNVVLEQILKDRGFAPTEEPFKTSIKE
jgi:hypothetical protein